MNKISLNLTSDEDNGAVVHLNAAFENREQAIEFHAHVASLCRNAARTQRGASQSAADIGRRLLGRT